MTMPCCMAKIISACFHLLSHHLCVAEPAVVHDGNLGHLASYSGTCIRLARDPNFRCLQSKRK
jgi:hypothetical protein